MYDVFSYKKTQYDIVNIHTLGKYLGKIFSSKKIKDVRGFKFGNLHQAISAFESYEKVDLGIDKETNDFYFDDYCNNIVDPDLELTPTMVISNMAENSSFMMN